MRTTVIPAQITTVEDKIAGNLNLTQIILLLVSLFVATFIYAVFPQRLHFSIYKIVLIGIQFFVFVALSLRVRGKVVLNWLFILSNYYFRPRFYVFNKNDIYLRDIIFPQQPLQKKAYKTQTAKALRKDKSQTISITDLGQLEKILIAHRDKLGIKFDKNGGINAFWQAK